jgi:hypothetical protein
MRAILTTSVVLLLTAFAGCASQDSQGTVGIAVTDAPTDDFESVSVTFSRAQVHKAGGDNESGWMEIVNESRTVDLLALHRNGTSEALGFAKVDAGRYTQVRIDVDNVVGVYAEDGSRVEMTVPSKTLRTSKSFEVKAGGNTTLTLEFDLDRSIDCRDDRCTFAPVLGKVEASDE